MTVYLMGCEGSRLVKIGHAGNPEKRLREIRGMSPHRLTLLWQSNTEHGEATERKLHQIFRGYRQHGEWFDFGDADPIALIAPAIDLPAPITPLPKPRPEPKPKVKSEPKPRRRRRRVEVKPPAVRKPVPVVTPIARPPAVRTYEVDATGHEFYIEDGHRYVLLPEEEFQKAWDEGCAEYWAAQANSMVDNDVG